VTVTLYERRRRLAVVAAAAGTVILTAWLTLGPLPESFVEPTVIPGKDLTVVHRALRASAAEMVYYVESLDPETLALRGRRLYYDANLAAVATADGPVGFFGTAWRPLADEAKLSKLDQPWPVIVATHDRTTGTSWLAGIHERALVVRRLHAGVAAPPETLTKDVDVESLDTTWSAETGATIAWRVKGSNDLQLATRVGDRFEPLKKIDLTEAHTWTILAVGPRRLALFLDRRVQDWSTLTLQVRCCAECGLPAPPSAWTFRDPFQILARRVTGVGAAVDGDRARIVFTRVTALQHVSVPLATLAPEPGATIVSVRLEAPWRRYVSLFVPVVLLFFSFTLVYLGFALVRERRAMLAAALGVRTAPAVQYADTLQRAMAFILDQMVLMPLFYIAGDALGVAPDGPESNLTDPRILAAIAILYGLNVAYFFVQEAIWGRTIGKQLVGIRVVGVDGAPLSVGRAFLRNALRILDAYSVTLFVGLASIVVTRRKQRIGDLIARTAVVQAIPDPPPPPPPDPRRPARPA
jgi:uncharacterized RDD family membrane protein YckC